VQTDEGGDVEEADGKSAGEMIQDTMNIATEKLAEETGLPVEGVIAIFVGECRKITNLHFKNVDSYIFANTLWIFFNATIYCIPTPGVALLILAICLFCIRRCFKKRRTKKGKGTDMKSVQLLSSTYKVSTYVTWNNMDYLLCDLEYSQL